MIGHEKIIELRRKGKRPAMVFLLDSGRVRALGDVRLSPADFKPDLRFLIGLDVVFVVEAMSDRVRSIWRDVKAAKPAFAILAVMSLGDAIKWRPGHRDIKLEEDWNG